MSTIMAETFRGGQRWANSLPLTVVRPKTFVVRFFYPGRTVFYCYCLLENGFRDDKRLIDL